MIIAILLYQNDHSAGIQSDSPYGLIYLGSILPKSLFDILHKLTSLLPILCGQRGRVIFSAMDI